MQSFFDLDLCSKIVFHHDWPNFIVTMTSLHFTEVRLISVSELMLYSNEYTIYKMIAKCNPNFFYSCYFYFPEGKHVLSFHTCTWFAFAKVCSKHLTNFPIFNNLKSIRTVFRLSWGWSKIFFVKSILPVTQWKGVYTLLKVTAC